MGCWEAWLRACKGACSREGDAGVRWDLSWSWTVGSKAGLVGFQAWCNTHHQSWRWAVGKRGH